VLPRSLAVFKGAGRRGPTSKGTQGEGKGRVREGKKGEGWSPQLGSLDPPVSTTLYNILCFQCSDTVGWEVQKVIQPAAATVPKNLLNLMEFGHYCTLYTTGFAGLSRYYHYHPPLSTRSANDLPLDSSKEIIKGRLSGVFTGINKRHQALMAN